MTFRTRAFGPTNLAARGFRKNGRAFITLILKTGGTFNPATGAVSLGPAPALVAEEQHRGGSPMASVAHASDLALVVPQAEVLVEGLAFAPRGTSVPSQTVHLRVTRRGASLIDKALVVVGDRRGPAGAPPPPPKPFTSLPLTYEKSLGGMTSRKNPVGVGEGAADDGLVTYPNVHYAAAQAPADFPAGLGPIAAVWPLRRAFRGDLAHVDATLAPFVDLPPTFDERYFQAAPADQRIGGFHPDDEIAIAGMHPDHAIVRLRLPPLRALAMAQHDSGHRALHPLRLDTIYVVPDALRFELVFRGVLEMARELADATAFGGAIDDPSAPFSFPDLSGTQRAAAAIPTGPITNQGTHVIVPVRGDRTPLPQKNEPPAGVHAPHAGTMILDADEPPPAAKGTMLIEAEATPRSLPFGKRVLKPKAEMTLLPDADDKPESLPFAKAAPKPTHAPAQAPGVAWQKRDEGAVRPADPQANETLLLLDEPEPEPEAAPIAVRPPPTPEAPAAPAAAKKAVWREDPPEQAPKAPAPPPPAPKADLARHLYRKMKK